jgi:hypothetical protein
MYTMRRLAPLIGIVLVSGCGSGWSAGAPTEFAPAASQPQQATAPALPVPPTTTAIAPPVATALPLSAEASPVIVPSATARQEQTTVVDQEQTVEPPVGSLLARRAMPPAGVSAQLDHFVGSGLSACDIYPSAERLPTLAITQVEERRGVGDAVSICLDGWLPDVPVEATIVTPDGRVRRRGIVYSSTFGGLQDFGWYLPPDASAPDGNYSVTAVQGDRSAGAIFNLAPASMPIVTIGDRDDLAVAAGTMVIGYLAGFAPDSAVELHLYSKSDEADHWEYRTTLPPVAIDATGRASFALPTAREDAPGSYIITTGTAPVENLLLDQAGFVLVLPPPFPGTLVLGSEGSDVVRLQLQLHSLGYSEAGPVVGRFDQLVELAVMLFQADNGLAVDGVVGPETWAALFEQPRLRPGG